MIESHLEVAHFLSSLCVPGWNGFFPNRLSSSSEWSFRISECTAPVPMVIQASPVVSPPFPMETPPFPVGFRPFPLVFSSFPIGTVPIPIVFWPSPIALTPIRWKPRPLQSSF